MRFSNLREIYSKIKVETFAGEVTGRQVYVISFRPLTLYIMIPTIDSNVIDEYLSIVPAQERIASVVLKENINLIIWGSLILHHLYGPIMGLFSGMVPHEGYNLTKSEAGKESELCP